MNTHIDHLDEHSRIILNQSCENLQDIVNKVLSQGWTFKVKETFRTSDDDGTCSSFHTYESARIEPDSPLDRPFLIEAFKEAKDALDKHSSTTIGEFDPHEDGTFCVNVTDRWYMRQYDGI